MHTHVCMMLCELQMGSPRTGNRIDKAGYHASATWIIIKPLNISKQQFDPNLETTSSMICFRCCVLYFLWIFLNQTILNPVCVWYNNKGAEGVPVANDVFIWYMLSTSACLEIPQWFKLTPVAPTNLSALNTTNSLQMTRSARTNSPCHFKGITIIVFI